MFYWSVVFFIVALSAGYFGFGQLSGDAATIAKVLAVVGLILAVISFISVRRAKR